MSWWWSWLLTAVGVTGLVLAGKKIWWAWYVNIACQALWIAYAIASKQFGFLVAAGIYTVVFSQNAIRWTRERHRHEWSEPEETGSHAEDLIAGTGSIYFRQKCLDESCSKVHTWRESNV